MKSEREIKIALLVILGLALLSSMTSCCSAHYNHSHYHHKPTKREIRRAMRYASWQYEQPTLDVMIPHSQSQFVFEKTTKK
jgi:hypothetical protein